MRRCLGICLIETGQGGIDLIVYPCLLNLNRAFRIEEKMKATKSLLFLLQRVILIYQSHLVMQ